jgi:hypothetical protein
VDSPSKLYIAERTPTEDVVWIPQTVADVPVGFIYLSGTAWITEVPKHTRKMESHRIPLRSALSCGVVHRDHQWSSCIIAINHIPILLPVPTVDNS